MDDAGELSTRHATGRCRLTAVLAGMAAALVITGGVAAGLLTTGGRSAPAADHGPQHLVTPTLVTPTLHPRDAGFHGCAGQPPGCGTAAGSAAALARGTWSALPAPPLSSRDGAISAWTGSQLVVWGGQGVASSDGDGAAYTPATRMWSALPTSPLSGRTEASAVWDGSSVLIWGGYNRTALDDGAAYDPATRTWTMLPASPLSGREGATALWIGREAVFFGGDGTASGAAFDPATNRWTALPAFPAPAGAKVESTAAVWTGRKVIAFATFTTEHTFHHGYSLRLSEVVGTWTPGDSAWERQVGPTGDTGVIGAAGAWDGRDLLLAGGSSCFSPSCPPPANGQGDASQIVEYRPGRGRAHAVVDEAGSGPAVWTGRSLVVLPGPASPNGPAVAYQPLPSATIDLPATPSGANPETHEKLV